MTNNLLAAVIIGLALIGGAYWSSQKTTVISTGGVAQGTIQVTGDGQAKATPDTVVLSLGAEVTKAQTQEQALAEMNQSINQIQTILKGAGIEEKNIQTSNLYAGEDFTYDNGRQMSNGYRASETLTIRIEKKEKSVTDGILDSIGKVKNIRINNVSYDTVDTTAAYTEARKMALAKARQKADEIAAATGLKIKKVQSVSEGSTDRNYPVMMNMEKAAMDSSAGSASSISLGQLEYSVSLNVVYEAE